MPTDFPAAGGLQSDHVRGPFPLFTLDLPVGAGAFFLIFLKQYVGASAAQDACFEFKKPKEPFRTKIAIAMESVVLCYRGSTLLSVPIRCHVSQEKNSESKLLSR